MEVLDWASIDLERQLRVSEPRSDQPGSRMFRKTRAVRVAKGDGSFSRLCVRAPNMVAFAKESDRFASKEGAERVRLALYIPDVTFDAVNCVFRGDGIGARFFTFLATCSSILRDNAPEWDGALVKYSEDEPSVPYIVLEFENHEYQGASAHIFNDGCSIYGMNALNTGLPKWCRPVIAIGSVVSLKHAKSVDAPPTTQATKLQVRMKELLVFTSQYWLTVKYPPVPPFDPFKKPKDTWEVTCGTKEDEEEESAWQVIRTKTEMKEAMV